MKNLTPKHTEEPSISSVGKINALVENLRCMRNSSTFGRSQKALFETIMHSLTSLQKTSLSEHASNTAPDKKKNVQLEQRKIRAFKRAGNQTSRVLLKV